MGPNSWMVLYVYIYIFFSSRKVIQRGRTYYISRTVKVIKGRMVWTSQIIGMIVFAEALQREKTVCMKLIHRFKFTNLIKGPFFILYHLNEQCCCSQLKSGKTNFPNDWMDPRQLEGGSCRALSSFSLSLLYMLNNVKISAIFFFFFHPVYICIFGIEVIRSNGNR